MVAETIAELMNWPLYRAEMAIKHRHMKVVNTYIAIIEANIEAGAFNRPVEKPDWYYRNPNEKQKNQGNAL
jgi:hypothetical protein